MPACERDGNRDPLAHAAGKLVRVRVQRRARPGDAHLLEQLEGAPLGSVLAEAEVAAHVLGQLLAHGEHRVQRRQRVLEDHRDVAAGHVA